MNETNPSSARRRILVVSSGLSPAVVTESLYALACTSAPAWVPDELHVITTGRGAELVRMHLLGPSGKVTELCREYGITPPRFDEQSLHVLHDDAGNIDPDAATDRAITRMGNLVLATLRKLGAGGDAELHLSLAGGRKTMSYFAGLALSLVGRPGDRLSHVVLSHPAFEFAQDFFYPPRTARPFVCKLPGQTPQSLSSEGALATLSQVPFVPLRAALREGLLRDDANQTLEDLVRETTSAVAPQQLIARFDCADGRVSLNDIAVPLSPAEAGLYYVLARCGEFNPRCSDDELFRYLQLAPHMNPDEDGMRSGMLASDAVAKLVQNLGNAVIQPGQRVTREHVSLEHAAENQFKRTNESRYEKFAPEFTSLYKKIESALGPLLAPRFKPQGRRGGPRLWPSDVRIEVLNEP